MTAAVEVARRDNTAAALWSAKHLGPVFPLDHPEVASCVGAHSSQNPCDGKRGKHPIGKWGERATRDPEQIKTWFDGKARNIGLACKGAGLLVVDEDEVGALTAIADGLGETIPETFTVQTSRGLHYYFLAPDGVELGNALGSLKGRGVDVRGTKGQGGYVVAPGSLHQTGALYEARDYDARPAPCPTWLVEALQAPQPAQERTASASPSASPSTSYKAPNGARLGEPVLEGRHDAVMRSCCSWRARRTPYDEALVLLEARYADLAQPPGHESDYTWEEAVGTLDDIYRRYPEGEEIAKVKAFTTAPAAEGEGLADAEDGERYPVLDWPTIFAAENAEVDWLCEPLLEAGRVVALFSPAKTGKSLLALEIAAALASGRPVMGNPVREPVVVLYVDLENSQDDIRERLTALGYGPDDLENLRYLSFPSLPMLDTEEGGRHLHEVATKHDARLVAIDTVSRVVEGEENGNDTFRALYRFAVMPLKRVGVAVLRLDHSGKDVRKGQRGASSKNDDVDAVWQLTARGGNRLDLRRTHARTNHGVDLVELTRHTHPLRHEVTGGGVAAEVLDLVKQLDRLEVPIEDGRTKCRAALTAAGITTRNDVLANAIRHRKGVETCPGTGAPPNAFDPPSRPVPEAVPESS